MWLLDAAGKALASNRFFPVPKIDASDREYFRWHQAGRPGIYISEPLVSRATGETFFDVSQRWDHEGKIRRCACPFRCIPRTSPSFTVAWRATHLG